MPFPWKKGGDKADKDVDDLEPELQAKPTMASMQAEYSMQNSELNESSLQYSEEVMDFAVYLGIDPSKEHDLLWIAEECLSTDLPPNWTEHTSSRGDIYFYNSETDESTAEHPLKARCAGLVAAERARRAAADRGDEGPADTPRRAAAISPQEVLDMCGYYSVNPAEELHLLQVNPAEELHLLQIVRQAVLAPLPWMYREVTDRAGRPYYYNEVTDVSQRQHPLDEHFQDRLEDARAEGPGRNAGPGGPAFRAWQAFFGANGLTTFYNFETGAEQLDPPEGTDAAAAAVAEEQAALDQASLQHQPFGPRAAAPAGDGGGGSTLDSTLDSEALDGGPAKDPYEGIDDESIEFMSGLLGMKPSDPKFQAFMRQLHEDKQRGMEQANFSSTQFARYDNRLDTSAPKMRPAPAAPKPRALIFHSWWFEDGVKKYLQLRYEMAGKVFHIVLNKAVTLRNVKIAGRDGELLQCWDLYVGQKLDILGKPTTLMQANQETLQWLEYHTRRLLRKAGELESEITALKPIPDLMHGLLHRKDLRSGTMSLRWLMKHVAMLTAQLYRVQPPAAT